ncbi:MAG: tRNA lysidine(34) synthetase TilS [Prevotella sp.]|nr:tRNA lysidine(34) synthetase TilS [Prevotella sp.]
MENIVKDFISRHHLLNAEDLHLVALSGGADSVCLLLMLQRLGYRVEAMHCNFHLRGEESDRDETFVADLCRKRDIPLHLAHFDTRAYADLHHVSIEMAARDLRYAWFEQLRHDLSAETICVAHHSDDNVETILMNLLRGTGLRGLQGIQPRRDNIVRPLLCLSRADIEQWLRQQGQPFVNDSTNAKADVIRNKLRLDIIPRLKEVFPQATDNILSTAHFAAEALRVYDTTITDRLSHLLSSHPTPNTPLGPKGCLHSPSEQEHPTPITQHPSPNTSLSIPALLQEPSPESLLFEWLSPKGFSSRNILQIAHSLTSSPQARSGREWSSSTHILVTHSDRLLLSEKPPLLGEVGRGQEVGGGLPPFPEPGTYVISPNTRLRISLLDGRHIERNNALICCADAATVTFPLELRHVRQGDRFRPLGMKGTRLVSDFLTDLHFSVIDKRRQLVLCDAQGNIVWLAGLRMDDHYKVTDSTSKTLQLSLSVG